LTVYRANLNADFPGDCVDHMTVEDRINLVKELAAIEKQIDGVRARMFDLQKG